MIARRNSERGQAVVELAITSVMFIAVLLFGIFFAEVGYISQKVQEAASYGMHDASGRRVTDFRESNLTGNLSAAYAPYRSLNGYRGVAAGATSRYADFDGATGSGNTFSQVMTSALNLRISCRDDNAIGFSIPNVSSTRANYWPRTMTRLRQIYRDQGGLSCTASATVEAINFPGRFLEGGRGGLAKNEELYDGDPIRVCGAGRAVSGNCRGSYGILTGDWALDEGTLGRASRRIDNESKQDRNGRPNGTYQNPGYRQLVRELYEANGDSKQTPGGGLTRAQQMLNIGGGFSVAQINGNPNFNDRRFLMSYAGRGNSLGQDRPTDFTDMLTRTGGVDTEYNTSGVYIPRWNIRSQRRSSITDIKARYRKCFLGLQREGCW